MLVITGMSGAGRSTAAKALEDLGWYAVDNLTPQLIAELAALTADAPPAATSVAVPVTESADALKSADAVGMHSRLLFLDATDEALVRRFESVRRPHPLQGGGTILDGITQERVMLGDLRGGADTVIDTSRLNVHELSRKVVDVFGGAGAPLIRVALLSFGFKYGLPLDADLVADVRFLPNPHWVPELRPRTGLDEPVSHYVLSQQGAGEFLDRYAAALQPVLAGYVRENKRYATVAVGCTGGKHRSVAMAQELATRLAAPGVEVTVVHRDLGRE